MPTYATPVAFSDGTVITSTFMDAQLFGNMQYMGTTHRHSTGTEGEGAGYIGPVAWVDGLGTAVPDAPTNATVLRVIATATSVGFLNSASATFWFGDTSHEHSIENVAHSTIDNTGVASANGVSALKITQIYSTSGSNGTVSTAVTIGGSGSRAVNVVGGGFLNPPSTATGTVKTQLLIDGVIQSSVTKAVFKSGATSGGLLTIGTLYVDVAAGSVTYGVRWQTLSGNMPLQGNFIDVREVKQS